MEPGILQPLVLLQLLSLFDGSGRTDIIWQWLCEKIMFNGSCPKNANSVYSNGFRQKH